MKENSKADCGFIFKREQNFRRRFFTEQNLNESFFGRSHFIRSAFISCERPDQLKDNRHVFDASRANGKAG